ncbi:MAG: hypothetical protein JWP69_1742 [Flaviaesturariibacter sp.]|nr:hypothetical protein [Flaviaesturariibacter sp.]
MAGNKSIFEFAEKFGYESPWDSWFPEKQSASTRAKITEARIEKAALNPFPNFIKSEPPKDSYVIVPVIIKVGIYGEASRVIISSDGQTKIASKGGSTVNTYEAVFNVRVQKSFIKTDQSNAQGVEFKIVVTDSHSKTVSDTRYLKTVMDTRGNITDSENQTANEHWLNCNFRLNNHFLAGSNVATSRTDSLVKPGGTLKTPVKAIVLHRTVGTSISGAISHSKGTHFYVEGGRKGKDGEVFQAISLKKSSNHIFDTDDRIGHLDVKTDNSIGIEVVGLAYLKKDGKYYKNVTGQPEITSVPPLSKEYVDINGNKNYWDALTEAQIKSLVCLVKLLMQEFSIPSDMILTHEEIQRKTAGEGQAVKDAIFSYLMADQ